MHFFPSSVALFDNSCHCSHPIFTRLLISKEDFVTLIYHLGIVKLQSSIPHRHKIQVSGGDTLLAINAEQVTVCIAFENYFSNAMTIKVCRFADVSPPGLYQSCGTPAVTPLEKRDVNARGLTEEFSKFHWPNILLATRTMETRTLIAHVREGLNLLLFFLFHFIVIIFRCNRTCLNRPRLKSFFTHANHT
jgi:hypothetical protein